MSLRVLLCCNTLTHHAALAIIGGPCYHAGMAYTPATPADLKARYAAFADTPDATLQYWLDDTETRIVLQADWTDPDGPVAQMLVAAHELTLQGVGTSAETANMPAGVTQMRSGSLSLSFDNEQARTMAQGGWMATKYGAQFLDLLKRARGGIRVTNAGTVPVCGSYRTGLIGG